MPAAKYEVDEIIAWMKIPMSNKAIHKTYKVSNERLHDIRELYNEMVSDPVSDVSETVSDEKKTPTKIDVLESIIVDGKHSSIPAYQQIAKNLNGEDKNRKYATKVIMDFLDMVLNHYRLEVK